MIPFEGFPKIPRLSRDMLVSEKIDGTNAQIFIQDSMEPFVLESGREVPFMCGSRTRWIFPENDNHGFAAWAFSHVEELLRLGPGNHFGEWWGSGIQRRYGLNEKRFSLFNVLRWRDKELPSRVGLVPTLYEGPFNLGIVEGILECLRTQGSFAAPGFMDPEGIVIFHEASRQLFKKTLKDDEGGKGEK